VIETNCPGTQENSGPSQKLQRPRSNWEMQQHFELVEHEAMEEFKIWQKVCLGNIKMALNHLLLKNFFPVNWATGSNGSLKNTELPAMLLPDFVRFDHLFEEKFGWFYLKEEKNVTNKI
jgi:hypothetical protein